MNEHDATEIAYKNGYAKGKIDAVLKMAEKLKKWFGDDLQRHYSNYNIHRYIDGITKEMIGANNGT